MTEKNSGPEEGIKEAVEGVKVKSHQDEADALRDVAKKEAEAEAARGGAESAEKRQESHQN